MSKIATLQAQRAAAEAERDEATEAVRELKSKRGSLAFAVRTSPTGKRRAELEQLEAEIAAATVGREQREAEIIVIEDKISHLAAEARFADTRAASDRLASVMAERAKVSRKADADMDQLIKTLNKLDRLMTDAASEGEAVGLRDSDQRLLGRGGHVSGWIRYRCERFLGGHAERAHRAFWQPLANVEGDFQRISAKAAAEALRKQRVKLGLPPQPAGANNNGAQSTTTKGDENG